MVSRRGEEARRRAAPTLTDDSVLDRATRSGRIRIIRETLAEVDLDTLVTKHGTPVLILDTQRVAEQYERLRAALPFVRWHYAVKSLPHPAVRGTIDALGGAFDVASDGEIDLLARQGVGPDRIIHTQPVKSPTEVTRACVLGIRTFVVDTPGALAKFPNAPANVSLPIRLPYRHPGATSDLNAKFGVSAIEAEVPLAQTIAQGNRIAGFSFHIGSQLDSVDAFLDATSAPLDLMEPLEHQWQVQFTVLNIGGGFPVDYRTDVARIEQLACALRSLLEPRTPCLRIIVEPGRVLVADAATLLTRVVGVRDRDGEAWCFIDDAVHGSYSNVISEGVHPVIVSRQEREGGSIRRPSAAPPATARLSSRATIRCLDCLRVTC